MTIERWACVRCGRKNAGSVATCAACGFLRGSVIVQPPPPPGPRPGGVAFPGPSTLEPLDALADAGGAVRLAWFGAPGRVIAHTRAGLRGRAQGAARKVAFRAALGTTLVVSLLGVLGASELDVLFSLVGILGPLLLGVMVGTAFPGVAGWALAMLGSAAGGFVVGVGLWLGVGLDLLDIGPGRPVGPSEALTFIPLLAMLVPILMGAQIGVGVVIGGALAAVRRHQG